ncbi:family-30 endo-beta-1,4-xylanase [Clohesyomyces aquaticus]|uniref:Family-30 endo-beta-1,4-xylanase n=1 Tax=Clohesyomyces aquaticus TaxID=1231657 RepID=A0A1Y2A626_9PLEO|nr:family-30 endo-beta-1,4-xylanase [Clohesyomyces aquaticus]
MRLSTLIWSSFLQTCLASHAQRHIGKNVSIPTVKITVDKGTHFQVIDGFGVSEAFQRSAQMHGKAGLSPSSQRKALDFLFSDEVGAGFTILRNGIGSSTSYTLDFMKSIAPTDPGGPNSTANYEWDGDDGSQVWLTKEALKYGVQYVYADAWSAPGYMKSNGNDTNGGSICGVIGTSCTSGDWRQAYANYLVQYLRFYKEKEGIAITHLGFLNEPDLNQTYASMQSSGFQAGDFLTILAPTLKSSGFGDVKLVCCEATGWNDGEDILAELQSIPGAEETLSVYSSHGYSSNPALPFKTSISRIWQTEWADLNGRWNVAWDNLGKEGEGISWANKIQQGLTLSSISGFLYWIGAETTTVNSALIRFSNDTISVSARLWAFAQFSRFVKPGAVRVKAESSVGYVRVSAFETVGGGLVLNVINNGHVGVKADVEVLGGKGKGGNVTSWLTNNGNNLTMGGGFSVTSGGSGGVDFNGMVPGRSMMSFVL